MICVVAAEIHMWLRVRQKKLKLLRSREETGERIQMQRIGRRNVRVIAIGWCCPVKVFQAWRRVWEA